MSIFTTRPDELEAQVGVDTQPSDQTIVEVLSDDSDSSYATMGGLDVIRIKFVEPTIPAGARVKLGRVRARYKGDPLVFDLKMIDPRSSLDTPGAANMYAEGTLSLSSPTFTTTVLLTDVRANWAVAPHVAPTDIYLSIKPRIGSGQAGGNTIKFSALYFETVYAVKPVVLVNGPSGTQTDSSSPTITFTPTLDDAGGSQTKYQVKVFTAAQYGIGGFDPVTSPNTYNSGVVDGAATSQKVPNDLADGTYRAYVRVAQTINGETFWGDFAYTQFTVAVDRPAAPTMTLTSEPASARVKVQLASNSGTATTNGYEVQKSLDGGTTWETLRTGLLDAVGGAGTTYDYESPNGVTVSYRARARHYIDASLGVETVSAWAATATSSWGGKAWWLKHPGQPALNLTLEPRSLPTSTRAARAGRFNVLGSRQPVVVSDVRSSAEGEIDFWSASDADRHKLDALLATGDPILIQAPPGTVDWPDRWCSIQDHVRERLIDKAWGQYAQETLPWVEVPKP